MVVGELCPARSDRYSHNVDDDDTEDDSEDIMFHSFSSCSPRYMKFEEMKEVVRLLKIRLKFVCEIKVVYFLACFPLMDFLSRGLKCLTDILKMFVTLIQVFLMPKIWNDFFYNSYKLCIKCILTVN